MDASGKANGYERLSPGAEALLGFLHPGGGNAAAARVLALPTDAWGETLALALRHGVAPLLHRALQSGGALARLPNQVRARLEEERRATALDNLRNLGQFQRIAQALRERDIPVIALKGLHLAELVYRDISLRPMSDLDVLVPSAQVEHAIAALLAMEFELIRGLPNGYDIGLTHRRLGILVEVHWALGRPSEAYTPPVEEIWRLALPTRLADADALVMSPEFLLLHVCTHLAHHHLFAFDLRALCDIAEIVGAHPALDWSFVIDQCSRNGGGRGVAAALRLARDHVGAKVPAEVLAKIGGDTLDAELLADALEQLDGFPGFAYELRTAPKLVALKSPIGWRAKIAVVWERIFVPRAELALLYGVPEHSARINLYYAVRLRDLVRRYAGSARELTGFRPQLAATTARRARLAQWVNET
ncbi:MAG: nucleotidyltransferase family protein [Burkholderiales bacterium]|nr:nucleotidyltransferase family protein [Burkholderiales bacterium]